MIEFHTKDARGNRNMWTDEALQRFASVYARAFFKLRQTQARVTRDDLVAWFIENTELKSLGTVNTAIHRLFRKPSLWLPQYVVAICQVSKKHGPKPYWVALEKEYRAIDRLRADMGGDWQKACAAYADVRRPQLDYNPGASPPPPLPQPQPQPQGAPRKPTQARLVPPGELDMVELARKIHDLETENERLRKELARARLDSSQAQNASLAFLRDFMER